MELAHLSPNRVEHLSLTLMDFCRSKLCYNKISRNYKSYSAGLLCTAHFQNILAIYSFTIDDFVSLFTFQ